jgi:Tfp pilus assembly PilM family ATPase
MKTKNKKTLFVFQLADGFLKVIKCLLTDSVKPELVSLEVEPFEAGISEKELSARAVSILKKLEYKFEPLIICLPRNLATCRYLKIPSSQPEEIEKIVNLQAGHYLPYPANELVTGYEIIQVDAQGYAYINLAIAHQDVVKRVLDLFAGIQAGPISIILSSYGLSGFYNYFAPDAKASPVMVIGIDFTQAELVIVAAKKIIFSRVFKLAGDPGSQEKLLVEEINKSLHAYYKEVTNQPAQKIFLIGPENYAEILKQKINLPVEVLSYDQGINLSKDLADKLLEFRNSVASLIGLGLGKIPPELDLLPIELKVRARKAAQKKEFLRLAALVIVIILIWAIGTVKNFDNKTRYLERLKIELSKVAKNAEPLEKIDKKFKFMQSRLQKNLSVLDVLAELERIVPEGVTLDNFSYEDGSSIILRGHAQGFNQAFTFVTEIEKAKSFKNFSPKIRYATQKKTQSGESVDFEITCLKK